MFGGAERQSSGRKFCLWSDGEEVSRKKPVLLNYLEFNIWNLTSAPFNVHFSELTDPVDSPLFVPLSSESRSFSCRDLANLQIIAGSVLNGANLRLFWDGVWLKRASDYPTCRFAVSANAPDALEFRLDRPSNGRRLHHKSLKNCDLLKLAPFGSVLDF